jgi:WhiB family redox-sensing transcriptional regulator
MSDLGDILLMPGKWADEAACKDDEYPDAWTPGDNPANNAQMTAYALQVCAGCDVKSDCLQFALEVGPTFAHGTWGGLTSDQRKHLWKKAR